MSKLATPNAIEDNGKTGAKPFPDAPREESSMTATDLNERGHIKAVAQPYNIRVAGPYSHPIDTRPPETAHSTSQPRALL